MTLKCSVCGSESPPNTVYRNNPKGQAPDWRCKKHLGKRIDPELRRLVDILERREQSDG